MPHGLQSSSGRHSLKPGLLRACLCDSARFRQWNASSGPICPLTCGPWRSSGYRMPVWRSRCVWSIRPIPVPCLSSLGLGLPPQCLAPPSPPSACPQHCCLPSARPPPGACPQPHAWGGGGHALGGGGQGCIGMGAGIPPSRSDTEALCQTPPPSRAPSLCPAAGPLTPSASFNGIGNRQ